MSNKYLLRLASRIAAQNDEELDESLDVLDDHDTFKPSTEYSCRIELSMIATFEGSVSKKDLMKKIQDEVKSSIKSGMQIVSNDLNLHSTEIKVFPIIMECVVVDESEEGLDEFGASEPPSDESDEDESEEIPDLPPESEEPLEEESSEEESEEEPSEEELFGESSEEEEEPEEPSEDESEEEESKEEPEDEDYSDESEEESEEEESEEEKE